VVFIGEKMYEDKQTGLSVRKLDYNSKDDVFADIQVIHDTNILLAIQKDINSPIEQKKMDFLEIGESHRIVHLDNYDVYAILNDSGIIATAGIPFNEKGFPYITLGTLKEFLKRYGDCVMALARFLKQKYKRIFLFHIKGTEKTGLNLKRYESDYLTKYDYELWELDV